MKKGKRILSLLLVAIMLLTSAPLSGIAQLDILNFTASAADPVKDYNATAGAEYARRYALEYNKEWYFYSSGGDCANFVSQCLFAGGMAMDGRWNCLDFNSYGYRMNEPCTWIRVNELIWYLVDNGGEYIERPSENQIELGDVIFYDWDNSGDWDHTAIVSGFSGSTPLVCGHTSRESDGKLNYPWNYGHSFSDINWAVVKLHGRICEPNNAKSYTIYQTSSSDSDAVRLPDDGSEGLIRRAGTYGTYDGNLVSGRVYGHWDKIKVNHTWGNWYTVKQSACISEGEKRQNCTRCGAVNSEKIPAGGHKPDIAEPTCTRPSVCTVCGKTLKNALGHVVGDWETKTESTCVTTGEQIKYCSRDKSDDGVINGSCGYDVETRDLPLAEHKKNVSQDGATCTGEGIINYECEVCKTKWADVPAVEDEDGKKWTEWVTVKNENVTNPELFDTKTQYRKSEKQTTTASVNNLSGWTLYNTTYNINWSGTTDWFDTYQQDGETYRYKGERTVYEQKTYLYRYRKWNDSIGWYDYSTFDRGGYEEEGYWVTPGSVYYDDMFGSGDANRYSSTELEGGVYPFLKGSTEDRPKTQYGYESGTKVYTYHFYKWNVVNDWTDEVLTANSDDEKVETRTLYRYRVMALGHDVENKVEIGRKHATCTEDGYVQYGCGRETCRIHLPEFDETLTKTGHNNMSDWEKYNSEKHPQVKIPYESDSWEVRFCQNVDKNTNTPCDYYETRDKEHIYVFDGMLYATCTEDGYEHYTCKNPEHENCEYNKVLPKTRHGNWDTHVEKEPTCTDEGVWVSYCKHINKNTGEVCNHETKGIIPCLGHDLVKTDEVPATCTEDGLKEYYTCTRCKHTFKGENAENEFTNFDELIIPALGHTPKHSICPDGCQQLIEHNDETLIPEKTKLAEKCGEYNEYHYRCQRAGCQYEEIEYKDPKPHNYVFKASYPATCHLDAYEEWECEICGDPKPITHKDTALGHEYLKEDGTTTHDYTEDGAKWIIDKEPTCDTAGSKHIDCVRYGKNNCTEHHVVEIPAKGHVWGESESHPTCTNPDSIKHTCTVCGETEVIGEDNPLGHQPKDECKYEEKPNTCITDGYKRWICQRNNNGEICGCVVDEEIIPKLGHDISEVIEKASCTEDGTVKLVCSRGDFECSVGNIPARKHSFDDGVVIKEPDCTNKGEMLFTCTNTETDMYEACTYTKTEDIPIVPDAHDWDEITYTWSEDNKTCTATKPCNREHKHDITETVNADVKTVDADCTKAGSRTYTATFENEVFETQIKTEVIGAKGHIIGDNWYVYKEATYDALGEKRNDCQRHCGYFEKEPIPKLKYKITFVVVNNDSTETVVKTVEYEKGAQNISAPSVPPKDEYVGKWEDYKLNSAPEIKVKAVYEPKGSGDGSELKTDKTAEYDEKNGVATITLNAFAKTQNIISSELEGKPLDIVLVVDQSGSMNRYMNSEENVKPGDDKYSRRENLKNVATSFVNTVYDNAIQTGSKHRISVVGFASASDRSYENTGLLTPNAGLISYSRIKNNQYKNSLMSVSDSKETVLKAINEIQSNGATAADLGLQMAENVFGNNEINTAERKRLVIFLTDGSPTYSSSFDSGVASYAIISANRLKNIYGATVYSIGITGDANPTDNKENLNRFLHRVSSNYDNATTCENGDGSINEGYYIAATNTESLQKIFDDIYVRSVEETIPFDSVTFYDTISEYFTLTTEQEAKLRETLKEQYGLTADDITVTRNNDGTTTLEVRGVNTKKVYNSSNVMTGYGASISFNVSANEKALNAGIYNTNTDDAYLAVDGKKVSEFETPQITINSPRNIVKFNIGDEVYSISQVNIGDTVVVPDNDYAHWDISENDVVSKSFTEFTATLNSSDRYIFWHIGDKEIVQSYKVGQVIVAPKVQSSDGNIFVGWDNEVPYRMPDVARLSFTAVFNFHEHKFTKLVGIDGNCEKGTVKTFACSCGKTEMENIPKTEHTYETSILNVGGKSVATFRCTKCGHSYDKTLSYSYKSGKNSTAYDLKLYNAEDISIQPDGSIRIRIYLTADMKTKFRNKTPVVYRYESGEYKKLDSRIEDNTYIVFTTDHFSTYIVAADDVDTSEIGSEGIICEFEGHDYVDSTILPKCNEDGYTKHTCSVCGNSYTDNIVAATGHTDADGDGTCDDCGEKFEHTHPSDPSKDCTCICHKTGFIGFIYKIIRIFWKLFKINKYCSCGQAHY